VPSCEDINRLMMMMIHNSENYEDVLCNRRMANDNIIMDKKYARFRAS
jgi:hypothetical protein